MELKQMQKNWRRAVNTSDNSCLLLSAPYMLSTLHVLLPISYPNNTTRSFCWWLLYRVGNSLKDWASSNLWFEPRSVWQVCFSVSLIVCFKMKSKLQQAYKEIVPKPLRIDGKNRAFNMLSKITNQQHVVIRMNFRGEGKY